MPASPEFWSFGGVGFIAQMVDGALGMAYGVTCIALLSADGVPASCFSSIFRKRAAPCLTDEGSVEQTAWRHGQLVGSST